MGGKVYLSLEVIRQNIVGGCQQTFCFQKFVDNTQQCFAFTPQANFPAHNSKVKVMGSNPGYLLNLVYFNTVSTVYGLTLSLVSLVSREKKERAVLYHPYDNRLGFAIFKSQCPKGSRMFSFLLPTLPFLIQFFIY